MADPSDLGSAGGEGVGSGAARVEPAVSTPALNSRPSALPAGRAGAAATASALPPYTEDEYAALASSIWSVDQDDLTLFDDLLHASLALLASIALAQDDVLRFRATVLLRRMEQRALWGPDHPVRQP